MNMNELIELYHANQRRNNNSAIPYTEHLRGVAAILISLVELCGEVTDPQLIENMRNAALGHDLLEDTLVSEAEIVEVSNLDTLRLIQELTNPCDDEHPEAYFRQIAADSEEARLIKYADILENTSSFCYSLHEKGIDLDRGKNVFIPILTQSTDVLAGTPFVKYPKTAEKMRNMVKVFSDLLVERIREISA